MLPKSQKSRQSMKFGQLIESDVRNNFLEKIFVNQNAVGKLFPDFFSKNQN